MSYTRSFTKTITVHYSGTVSYPASQSGGTRSYSGTTTETVVVNVEVETDPFDHSVSGCNKQVDVLTGAVSATESAQVLSIHESSRQISSAIIEGFFKTVRSGLSSQIMELSQKVETRLMHLQQQSKMLLDKRSQMEESYNRTKARYIKIFEDINRELENRVTAIDMPAFDLERKTMKEINRMIDSDSTEIVSQSHLENAVLHSQISAASARKRAQNAIDQILAFLKTRKTTDHVILQGAIQSMPSQDVTCYLPVCFVETTEPNGGVSRNCIYDESQLGPNSQEMLQNAVFVNPTKPYIEPTDEERAQLEDFFSSTMAESFADRNSEHDTRVRNLISKMFYSK